MKNIVIRSSAVLLLCTIAFNVYGQAQNNPNNLPANQNNSLVFCSVHSLQAAVDRAAEGGWIVVQEICNEEVVIRKDRLRIDGVNDPTIVPSAGGTAFTVLADNVEISGFNIVGGETGIEIVGGASAEVHHNQITGYTGDGIFIVGNASGIIHDNVLTSSTDANLSAISVATTASAVIEGNTINASSGSGIFVAGASSALVGCNDISVSDPFFAGMHITRTSALHLAEGEGCENMISNTVGPAIFCSQTSSILVLAAQDITAGIIDLHANCELVVLPGVMFP